MEDLYIEREITFDISCRKATQCQVNEGSDSGSDAQMVQR